MKKDYISAVLLFCLFAVMLFVRMQADASPVQTAEATAAAMQTNEQADGMQNADSDATSVPSEGVQTENATATNKAAAATETILSSETQADPFQTQTVLVYLAQTGEVCPMSLRAYCIGAVAAEMPALYEKQALCAQAAASLNFVRAAMLKGPRDSLDGAHISSSSAVDQAYLTNEQLRARWGSQYDVYYARIAEAVDAVLPYKIVDGDELCVTAFHAVSPGRTEESENVWSGDVPYLSAVDSSFDSTSPDYLSQKTISASEFGDALATLGFASSADASQWLGAARYSDSGTLLSLAVGNISVTGAQLRSVFGLKSAAVTVEYTDGKFVLTVRGYGHGVGMSQYGAQQLALQGKTWQEIIYHYYKGVQIVSADA